MSYIEFKNINKSYDGKNYVLKDLNLTIDQGHLVTLLGPSGCGKSTLLRILAGFEPIDSGQIIINGKDVTNLPPAKRNIGMVFQHYSLFPNMTVEENIAFGLKINKVSKDEIKKRVAEMIDIVDLKGKEDYRPHNLSGGQKQRVALARALITNPKVLLLDEPLSAIDAKLRKSLQQSISEIQKRLGITTIFVTHDQDEAMILSDIIHLMYEGRIEQSGNPHELYIRPKTYFSASFIGNYNVLSPENYFNISGEKSTKHIAIRPEAIEFVHEKTSGENGFFTRGKVVRQRVRGSILSYKINVNGVDLRVDELYRSFNYVSPGSEIDLFIEYKNCLELDS